MSHAVRGEYLLAAQPEPEESSALIEGNADWTGNRHRMEMVAPWIFAFGANGDVSRWLELGAEYRLCLNSLVKQ